MLNRHGFTLMEIIITVIIISVLLAVAIPNYIRTVEAAKCSHAMKILTAIHDAAYDYFADNNTFAGALTDLEDYVGANFYSTANSNPDWTFSYAGAAATFTATATRRSGPFSGTAITLTQDDVWGGGYPRDNPTNF